LTAALLLCLACQLRSGDTLEAVRFEGNRSFSRAELIQVVTCRPHKPSSDVQLGRDAGALESFYQNEGFSSVQVEKAVTSGRRWQVVTFKTTEGPHTRVTTIVLSGNNAFATDRLLREMPFRPGAFFSQGQVDAATQALRAFYLNSGYPFVLVTATVDRKDSLATAWFSIQEGQLCHIKEVRVRGNRTVRTKTILRASEIRPGEKFSQNRVLDAQRRLYATKLFSAVMFYVLADSGGGQVASGDEVVVRFDVVEQPCRDFGLGAGGEIPPLRLLVSADWEHDNLFNDGQSVLLNGEYSPTFSRDYRFGIDGTYKVPYLFLARIDLQTHPFVTYERVDTNLLRNYGIETGMSRNIAPQFTVGLSNRLLLVSDTSSGITNSLALTGQYDTRNDFFDPSSGVSIQTVAEVAGGFLGGVNDLHRLTAECRWFLGLGPERRRQTNGAGQFVLAMRGLVGRIWPYGRTTAVPYYEAFTLGGVSSLRGYADRSLGPDTSGIAGYRFGPAVVNGNVELRSPYVRHWVGLTLFGDIGSLGRDLRLFAYEYSAGIGVCVRTPIGPVRLDWGKRLKNPPAGDKGRFYLGLLHAF